MTDTVVIQAEDNASVEGQIKDAVDIAETIVETAQELSRGADDTTREYLGLRDELERQGAANADVHREILTRLDILADMLNVLTGAVIVATDDLADAVDDLTDEVEDEVTATEDVKDHVEVVAETVEDIAPEVRTARKRKFI